MLPRGSSARDFACSNRESALIERVTSIKCRSEASLTWSMTAAWASPSIRMGAMS
jgi:hypothetical protein